MPSPWLESLARSSYDAYWALSHRFHLLRWQAKNGDQGFDPLQLRHVSPGSIVHNTGRTWCPWSGLGGALGTTKGGDWDRKPTQNVPDCYRPYPRRFDEHPIYASIEAHFLKGKPWEDTPIADRFRRYMQCEDHDHDVSSKQEMQARFQRIERLHDSLRQHGYLTQRELIKRGHAPLSRFREALFGEITIDLDRSGNPLFVDGRHRLALAKILDIDTIPVLPIVRHEQWVQTLNGPSDSLENV